MLLVPECKHSLVPASKTWHSVVWFLSFSSILDILWIQRFCNWLMNYEMIVGWVHIWLYVVHQYFQRHVAAAVRVWLVLVTCGRPLVGHSDWINSHQKHAVDWVVCSCTRPHAGPRVSDIASRHHEKTAASVWPRPRPGTGKRSDVTPLLNDGWRSGRKKRERRRGTAVCAPLWNPPFLPHREETSVDLYSKLLDTVRRNLSKISGGKDRWGLRGL